MSGCRGQEAKGESAAGTTQQEKQTGFVFRMTEELCRWCLVFGFGCSVGFGFFPFEFEYSSEGKFWYSRISKTR